MRRAGYAIFGLLGFFGTVFFAGCPEVLSPPVTPATGSHALVVRIAGDPSAQDRTALPSVPDIAAYKYNISVIRGTAALGGLNDVSAGVANFVVPLTGLPQAGDMVFVEGFKDSKKCAGGSYILKAEDIGSASVTVTLYPLPLTEGTGKVDLSVNIPTTFDGTDEITAAELSLYRSLADYQAGNFYDLKRYRKSTTENDYGAWEDLGSSIPIKYDGLPSGNYVIQIEFFRLKYVRVSRLVQTVIVRGGLTTNTWDGVSGPLSWGENKFASSDAEPVDIKIDGTSIKKDNSLPAAHSIYTPVIAFPPQEKVSLTVTPKPGQNIAVSLNGGAPAGGGSHSLTMAQTNSIVIAVTAPDGVATQTYTVSYTYRHTTEWHVSSSGSANNVSGDGTPEKPFETVARALEVISDTYKNDSGWPGKDSDKPVAARINISGEITEAVNITATDTVAYPPIILAGSDTGKITAPTSSRPLAITKATVILGDGLTLTGGNKDNGGGVLVEKGGAFTMNGGTISGNTATTSGGGVYVTSSGSSFTMNGGTISGNTATTGGGVYVESGSFTMNGGTISGSGADKNANNGGGVYINNGAFTMNGGTIGGSGADKNTASTSGGGVYINYGNFVMSGGTISGNTATSSGGGGVYVANGSFEMKGGSIGGNTARVGGGVYLAGNSSSGGQFIMRGGSVSGNTAAGSGTVQCGGVYVASSGTNRGFTMEGGAISGNTAPTGGGVYVASTGKFTMTAGNVSGNKATGTGGGVYVASTGANGFTMAGGAINGNAASNNGGGVFVSSGSFGMSGQSRVSGNAAGNNGGGVFVSAGSFGMSGQSSVNGNTATGTGGGGVYVASNGTFTMSGGSVSGNTATGTGGGGVYVTGGAFTMSGGSVSENEATYYGGGVYVTGNGTFTMTAGNVNGNTATGTGGGGVYVTGNGSFTMSGGSISGNTATNGGGVFFDGGGFNMADGAVINQDNDVWLVGGKTISVGALSSDPTIVARITPSLYTEGTQVLAGDFASYVDKFTVTPEGTINWKIGTDGKLLQLTTPTIGTY